MRTLLVFTFSIVALAGAPLAAADEVPSAAFDLCSLAPNPLLVDFGALATCTATAECAPFNDVSCSADGSTTSCSSTDRDCSTGERGSVTCNGSTTYCAGECCGSDGVCEEPYGCSSDPDCGDCSSVTNCQVDTDCGNDGSICLEDGMCLCAGP